MRRRTIPMGILVLLNLYAAAASAPSSPYGGGSGVIAFDTERGGNSEIYSITWDGSNETNITHSAATIRQNTNTKIFMRSSDRELDYAADYVQDVRQLTSLKTGEALIHNPQFGTVKVAVRPPFSKVIELSPAESEALLAGHDPESDSPRPSGDLERELLRVIRQHIADAGEPINVTQAMDAIGVASGRKKQELLATLEQRGLIRSERLKQRGGPRVLYPTGP